MAVTLDSMSIGTARSTNTLGFSVRMLFLILLLVSV